jgi:N-acetylmuramoyl-L-alanine amidase
MTISTEPMPFPARFDYGARTDPTLAVVFHMAEGRDVAQYLAHNPLRGVSVHYTIEQKTARWQDGEIVRCLAEDRISGSLNAHPVSEDPNGVRDDDDQDGFYGISHVKYALGKLFGATSVNKPVISVEVAGFEKDGPTRAQALSMLRLFDDVNARYGRVIPLAHRDFQRVKPCPGKTPLIKAAFGWMGGHGKSYLEARYVSTSSFSADQICDVDAGAALFDWAGGPDLGTVDPPLARDYLGSRTVGGQSYALIGSVLDGKSRTLWVSASHVKNVRARPTTAPDCSAAVAAEHDRVKAAAVTAIGAL